MPTFYKGKIGFEDVEFGVGTFLRYDSGLNAVQRNQINRSNIPRKVIAKTASYSISNLIGEYIFTNEGAAGAITFSLPPAIAGMGKYYFIVIEAQNIIIDPNGVEYFRDCAAGKYKVSAIAGNRLVVWCDTNGIWEWDYDLVSGDWTNEA